MTKQESIELGKLYKAQLEWAVNQIGLTFGNSQVQYRNMKVHVANEEELDLVLSAFSFEETYVDIDWEKGWRGIGFVIYFNSKIPAPFTLA